MPRCIVCKGYYNPDDPGWGTVCQRCHSDNADWVHWKRDQPIERGDLHGLFLFTEQYFHLPFIIILTSFAFGLMGTAGAWQMIRFFICLLVIIATAMTNVAIVYGAYQGRHRAREKELLAQFRATLRNKVPNVLLSTQWQTMLISIVIVGLILLLTYALMRSDLLRALAQWLLFEPAQAPLEPETEARLSQLRERAEQVLPIITLIGYVAISITLTLFSTKLLTQQYTARLNEVLPNPIFLQGRLLMRVVQDEVEKQLCQTENSTNNPQANPQSGHGPEQKSTPEVSRWTWDNLQRTNDGGVKLIARTECADSRVEESITGHRTKYPEFIDYVVEADPWGHIIKITPGERRSQY